MTLKELQTELEKYPDDEQLKRMVEKKQLTQGLQPWQILKMHKN